MKVQVPSCERLRTPINVSACSQYRPQKQTAHSKDEGGQGEKRSDPLGHGRFLDGKPDLPREAVKILQITEHSANCRPVLLCSDGMSAFMIQQWVKKSGRLCETDFAKLKKIHSEKRARIFLVILFLVGLFVGVNLWLFPRPPFAAGPLAAVHTSAQ
ncbi:MAG: hypothetical protein WBG18_28785 [Xanthobacteraceae bacterium]